jgi:putative aminopeptidase FrvX
MTDITPFIKSLLSTSGLTGFESPVAALIEARWRPLTDEIHLSRLGSVHALRRGNAPAPRPSLLLSAHMDAIGMMVAGIVDGFLSLTNIGMIDTRLLPGQPVLVHGRQSLPGVIAARPALLMPEDAMKDAAGFDHLLVDVGLPPRRVAKLVRVGDLVSFATDPLELGAGILSGHSLDNRASIAALTRSLEAMRTKRCAWDVWFAATVQEETTFAGGATSAFALHPDLAIVLDVTYAKSPNVNGWETFPLGIGPHIHPFLLKRLKELAERLEIPYAIEPMPEISGTEADFIQLATAGIPTAVISIPIRYMHAPVEVAALVDVERAGRLVAEFAIGLNEDFMASFQWDE